MSEMRNQKTTKIKMSEGKIDVTNFGKGINGVNPLVGFPFGWPGGSPRIKV